MKPLFDRVIILPDKKEEQTTSGIFLTNVSEEKSQIGTVVSVGDGGLIDGKEVVMQVKVGDRVLYSKFAGTEIKTEGKEYLVIKQTDILAIL